MRRFAIVVVACLAFASCAPSDAPSESPSPSPTSESASPSGSPTPTDPPSPTGSPSASPSDEPPASARLVGTATLEGGGIAIEPADDDIAVKEYDDGSVRASVRLEETGSPQRFEMHVHPTSLDLRVHGGVLQIADAEGTVLAVMGQPEVLDVDEQPVAVQMSVIDTVVVVKVSTEERHTGNLEVNFWLGNQLIDHVSQGISRGEPRYSVVRTPFGRALLGRGLGSTGARQSFETLGWEQALQFEPAMASSESLQQQYDCHVLGAPNKESWNLEAYRPDFPEWLVTSLDHRCNWEEEDVPQQPEPEETE